MMGPSYVVYVEKRRGPRTDPWNGLKTHDRGGRKEESKAEYVREDKNDTKVCCSVEVAQKKAICLYTHLHTRRLNASASVLFRHQINTLSN